MRAVPVVLFSLAGSTLAMPPTQRLERRVAVTDDQWSNLWANCSKVVINAQEDCKNGGSNDDCYKIGRKTGTECLIDNSQPKMTEKSRHDKCKASAVQGVEDCMNGKDNKTVPECQRGQLESYLRCTSSGIPATPMTEQDEEYNKIWSDKCTKPSQKAGEECKKIQDFGGKCEHERNDNDMKCLLDNSKARAKTDFVHNVCISAAVFGANDCFYTNNKGKTLSQCQREQWDAYPECVKKHESQDTATQSLQDGCSTSTS